MGRLLIGLGLLLVVIGFIIEGAGRFFPLGRLPGDIAIQRPGLSFYFPLGSSILISIVLSVILYVIGMLRK